MFTAPTDLPDDPVMLQAILRAALAEIERLELQIAGLQRHRFGRRSERLDETALAQGVEDLEQSVADRVAALEATMLPQPADARADAEPADRFARHQSALRPDPRQSEPAKRHRGALPAHLARVEVLVDIDDKTCPCCGGCLHPIGEDRAEMLD